MRHSTLTVLISLSCLAHLAFGARAEAADQQEAAAIDAIEQLGGFVRPLAANTDEREIDFSLRGKKLTDVGLTHVQHIKNVVVLRLGGTKITNAGLANLKDNVHLRRLYLENTQIGDEGLAHLAGLENLEYLNVYGTQVGDAGLNHLKGLKRLRDIYVWQTNVTDEGVEQLSEALPQLTIVRGADKNPASGVRRSVAIAALNELPVAGAPWTIDGIGYEGEPPGPKAKGRLFYRPQGKEKFAAAELTRSSDGRLAGTVPGEVTEETLEYYIEIREPGYPRTTYPPAGARDPAQATPDTKAPVLAGELKLLSSASYQTNVSWTAATDDQGIAAYRIHRADDPAKLGAKENLLAEVAADQLEFQDVDPPAGQTVWYAAAPVDVAGRVGEPRSIKVVVPKDTPPINELQLTATAGSNAVVLRWTGTPEPDVTHVLILRAAGKDEVPKQVAKLDDPAAARWIDKDVDNDTKYNYLIKLVDKGGHESLPSKIAVAAAGLFVRRINCGGPQVLSPDGDAWEADDGAVSGTGRSTAKSEVAGAGDELQDVYRTERWSNTGLRYRFPVEQGRYLVVLHFAETNRTFSAAGKRIFDVRINDELRHGEVDVFARAGAMKAWQLPTEVDVKGKEILLELLKHNAGPSVKGIEVRRLPD